MSEDEATTRTRGLLNEYLSILDTGPRTIEGASVSKRAVMGYGLPADASSARVLVEEPDQGWSVAIEVACRAGTVWRVRIADYYDDADAHGGPAAVQAVYLDWLRAL